MSKKIADEITVNEALCLLFRHKAAAISVCLNESSFCVRQEELIAAMERGFDSSPLGHWLESSHRCAGEVEDFSPDESIVLVEGASCRLVKASELKRATAGEGCPAWVDLPFPLIHRNAAGKLSMNSVARGLLEGEYILPSILDQALKDKEALCVVNGRSFLLRHLGHGYFTIEDIDEEVELAREIIWQAAVGKALLERLEREGVKVGQLPDRDFPTNGVDGELISCSWGDTPLGYLLLKFQERR
jgi:hypothetical protein